MIETRALRRSNVVKTALLRSVSHDLRSPLTAITAAAGGLALAHARARRRAPSSSRWSRTESERLTRLVDNLLDLSRVQAGQLEPRADWTSAEELIEAAIASGVAAGRRLRGRGRAGACRCSRPTRRSSSGRSRTWSRTPSRYAGARAGDGSPAQRIGADVAIRVTDRGPGDLPRRARADLRAVPRRRARRAAPGSAWRSRAGSSRPTAGALRAQSLPGQGATFTILMPAGSRRRRGGPRSSSRA